MIQSSVFMYVPSGKGDKKGKDSKGKKKDSKEDKTPAIVSDLCIQWLILLQYLSLQLASWLVQCSKE